MSEYQPTFTISTDHPLVTVDAVSELVAKGTTEKRAVAVILNQNGYTHQQGGDAMKDLFGSAVKSGGFGNLVNDGKDDVGIARERTGSGGGGRTPKVRELDPVQEMRDTLDRERAALDAVESPVTVAQQALDALASDPDKVVDAEQDRLQAVVRETQALIKALAKDSQPFVDAERERLTARVETARSAAAEAAKVHRANVERLSTVIDALDAIQAPASA